MTEQRDANLALRSLDRGAGHFRWGERAANTARWAAKDTPRSREDGGREFVTARGLEVALLNEYVTAIDNWPNNWAASPRS